MLKMLEAKIKKDRANYCDVADPYQQLAERQLYANTHTHTHTLTQEFMK